MEKVTETTFYATAREKTYGPAKVLSFSLATLSLIDPKLVTLPLVDRIEPSEKINRDYICGNKFYRFANFLDARIFVENGTQITSAEFAYASGLYRDNSFMGHDSQAFKTNQYQGAILRNPKDFKGGTYGDGPNKVSIGKITMGAYPGARFVQTAGARTKTSDDAGRRADLREITDEISLPPIWTTLRVSIYVTGEVEYDLLYHSLFPSVWLFAQDNANSEQYNFKGKYNGTFSQMMKWVNGGFGPVTSLVRGANPGNPWKFANPHKATRRIRG